METGHCFCLVLALQQAREQPWGGGRLLLSFGVVNDTHNVAQHSSALWGRELNKKHMKIVAMLIIVTQLSSYLVGSQSVGDGQYMW